MSYADEIRRQAEAAPRAALPTVTAALWRAYGEGKVSEAEAEALSALIGARHNTPPVRESRPEAEGPAVLSDRVGSPRRAAGSRPRTDASMERRRRWAASGRLPPGLAARFTLAEQAVLSLVAAETARRKDCRLAVEHMAAVAGVSRSTVKTALREARQLGLITVEERKVTGWRNDTNVVRIVSPEWTAWLRLARRPKALGGGLSLTPEQKGGGVNFPTGTPTEVPELRGQRPAEAMQGAAGRGKAGSSSPGEARLRIARGGSAGRRGHASGSGLRPV